MKYTIHLDDGTYIGTAKTVRGARSIIGRSIIGWLKKNQENILADDLMKDAEEEAWNPISQYFDEWDMPCRFEITKTP